MYRLIRNPEHLEAVMAQSPSWPRLWQDAAWAGQLVHVGKYTTLLADMHPDTIPRMAAFISVIRPGKAHLQRRPWPEVFESVWEDRKSVV